MNTTTLTIDEYKKLDRMLADAPDLRTKVLPAHKPVRTFPASIRAIDLAKHHVLVIATGVQADVTLSPLVDSDGFEMKLGKLSFLAPFELAEVLSAHERRIEPLRGMIGRQYLMANEDEWRRSLTPFVVVEDRFTDFREVMASAGVSERDKRGMVTPALRNFVTSTASVDPSLTAAWIATEHQHQLSKIIGHVVQSDEPIGDLETMLVKEGIEAANRNGETFGEHRQWWASKVKS